MDIGCYLIFFSRLIFRDEPRRVMGLIKTDETTRTDVLTSGTARLRWWAGVLYLQHAHDTVPEGSNRGHQRTT